MAIVAAKAAATRNLLFIGTRRKNSSVPKGKLVSPACQSKRGKKLVTDFRAEGRSLNFIYSRGASSLDGATVTNPLVTRPADRFEWRGAREGSTPAWQRPSK